MASSQPCLMTHLANPLSQETRPCGGPADTDCHVGDWHEWTSCSAVCGKGRHTRMRRWSWIRGGVCLFGDPGKLFFGEADWIGSNSFQIQILMPGTKLVSAIIAD